MLIVDLDPNVSDASSTRRSLRPRTQDGHAYAGASGISRPRSLGQRKKRKRTSALTASASQRPRVSRWVPIVKIEKEDVLSGLIRCPSCHTGIQVSERGCNLVTCKSTAHEKTGGFYYFCYHCRNDQGNPEGYCSKCPQRNSRQTRATLQQKHRKDVELRNAYI